MAYVAPTTRADGYVVDAAEWNKNTVDNPIALRTGAVAIAAQATGDVIIATGTSQFGLATPATAGHVLTSNGAGIAPTFQATSAPGSHLCQGRLTLTTGVPVTVTDVTAAGTLFWTPYKGNRIALYSGTAWVEFSQAQLSMSVPAVATQTYDVFVDYNAGVPALAMVAWTNDTTRATALTTQDGTYVLTGTLGRRYVGTVRTVSASQLNDSFALRHVWNYYHQVPRVLRLLEATNSWAYTTDTLRQARATATNQLDVVIGLAEVPVEIHLIAIAANDNAAVALTVGIGEDSTTVRDVSCIGGFLNTPAANTAAQVQAVLKKYPAIGRHVYTWLEQSAATGTTTWFGDNNGLAIQSGLHGTILG